MSCTTAEYQRHPGKFELSSELGGKLYELSMLGCDDETGSVDEREWYGLLLDTGLACAPHAIVFEDNDGSWDYEPFGTAEDARKAFAEVVSQLEDEELEN